MSNGEIKHVGSFEDCVAASDGELHLVSHSAEEPGESSITSDEVEDSAIDGNDVALQMETNEDAVDIGMDEGKLVSDKQDETKFTGVVSNATFVHYAKSMGSIWLSVGLILLFTVTQVVALVGVAAIGVWSELDAVKQVSEVTLYHPFSRDSFSTMWALFK